MNRIVTLDIYKEGQDQPELEATMLDFDEFRDQNDKIYVYELTRDLNLHEGDRFLIHVEEQ